jgi:hypothetical protein
MLVTLIAITAVLFLGLAAFQTVRVAKLERSDEYKIERRMRHYVQHNVE